MPKLARKFSEGDPNRPEASNLVPLVGLLLFFGFVGWRWGWQSLLIIAGIVLMIFLHELGHYVMAKRAGMKVTEFFIGFGPRIWSFRRGETEYGIKAIWLGAYVRIIGMHNLEEVAPEDEPRAYRQQPFRHRLAVALAGSTTHFLVALLLLWTIFVFHGAPSEGIFRQTEPKEWTIEEVVEDSAAARAGLQPGDRIVAFNGTRVERFSELRNLIEDAAGDQVTLTVLRNGEELNFTTTVGARDDGTGFLGVGPRVADVPIDKSNPIVAVPKAVGDFAFLGWESTKAMVDKLSPSGLADLGRRVFESGDDEAQGPVVSDPNNPNAPPAAAAPTDEDNDRLISILGAIGIGSDLVDEGWVALAIFFISLNVFIGLINLVPLLPFDGGHVAIAVYEKIRTMLQGGRAYHVDVMKLLPITYGVFLILGFIALSSIYLDAVDPVSLD